MMDARFVVDNNVGRDFNASRKYLTLNPVPTHVILIFRDAMSKKLWNLDLTLLANPPGLQPVLAHFELDEFRINVLYGRFSGRPCQEVQLVAVAGILQLQKILSHNLFF